MAIPIVDRSPRHKHTRGGVLGCMVIMFIEAAVVADLFPSSDKAALPAVIVIFFIREIPYSLCLTRTQFAYPGEICLTHLRERNLNRRYYNLNYQHNLETSSFGCDFHIHVGILSGLRYLAVVLWIQRAHHSKK
ncbi:hypothetical protein EJ04DRAFT_126536 [Polyplosphaeria fusca]|uniref:Uncharacterized protein n=1 Tax=Polyplosphaeria fusca TaxID=682080 RepID=A0A9P4R6J0_9PLEO|nr:hypothetical protein EJ04DRAFT_126536 [Polyplosphaeria fusca]